MCMYIVLHANMISTYLYYLWCTLICAYWYTFAYIQCTMHFAEPTHLAISPFLLCSEISSFICTGTINGCQASSSIVALSHDHFCCYGNKSFCIICCSTLFFLSFPLTQVIQVAFRCDYKHRNPLKCVSISGFPSIRIKTATFHPYAVLKKDLDAEVRQQLGYTCFQLNAY